MATYYKLGLILFTLTLISCGQAQTRDTELTSYSYCEIKNNEVAFHVPVTMIYPLSEKGYEMLVNVYCDSQECAGLRLDLFSLRETNTMFPNSVQPMLGLKLNSKTDTLAELSWGSSTFKLDTVVGELVWTQAGGEGKAQCNGVTAL